MSSSFVPKMVESTTPTAAAASATPSADQNESIDRPELTRSARSSIPASTNSTPKKPTSAVNGSRSAATSGGRTAFSTAMSGRDDKGGAERRVGRAGNELRRDDQRRPLRAASASTSCPARKRGRSGVQPGASPYAALTEWPGRRPPTWPPSSRAASPAPRPGGAWPRHTSRRRDACRRPTPTPRS